MGRDIDFTCSDIFSDKHVVLDQRGAYSGDKNAEQHHHGDGENQVRALTRIHDQKISKNSNLSAHVSGVIFRPINSCVPGQRFRFPVFENKKNARYLHASMSMIGIYIPEEDKNEQN